MSTFVPPLFKNFGKNVQDLFKKKFEYDHTVKTINKSANGVTLESGGVSTSKGARGYVKGKLVNNKYGEAEIEINTDASPIKTTAKLTQLADRTTVTLTAASNCNAKAELEYNKANFAIHSTLNTDCKTHAFAAGASVGLEGFSLGCGGVIDLSKSGDVTDVALGAEYTQKDFTASLFTEKNLDYLNAGYLYKYDKLTTVGALLKIDLHKPTNGSSLQIGGEYLLNNTLLKGKIDYPSCTPAMVIEHRLAVPALSFGLAARFTPINCNANCGSCVVKAEQYGVTCAFGDY